MENLKIQSLGFIGLGRMGQNMVNRLLVSGFHNVIVYNRSSEKMIEVQKKGAKTSTSVSNLLSQLNSSPKVVWLMLPAGDITESHFNEVIGILEKGDILIDGANSNFKDTIRRHKIAEEKGIKMLDIGVSGGVVAAERGYAMMIGGPRDAFEYCTPIFDAMCMKGGYYLVGEEGGSGHYVKMIHNAVEYGMMQAIGEGFDLLKNGRFKNLDLQNISVLWNHGTIVQSFLMEMVQNALSKDSALTYLKPYIEDNGEGKWAVNEAMDYGVPFTTNAYALFARYASRDDNSFSYRLVAAMRNEFGGHKVKKNDN